MALPFSKRAENQIVRAPALPLTRVGTVMSRIRQVFSGNPAKLTSRTPIINERPLWEQHQRIGGSITPVDVSNIMQAADMGLPERFVDLHNELRQKDGHLQGDLATRERAPALHDFEFVEPEDATAKEKEGTKLCRRVRDDFRNWPVLIEHMTAAVQHGHNSAVLNWEKTKDGFILPVSCTVIPTREFIFHQQTGQLRYRRFIGDIEGADIVAENPGRIIQVQRRINGDVPSREGLSRFLVWCALFRNWDLRDWLALGEIGWKPWRWASYNSALSIDDEEVQKLIRMLENLGARGVAAVPEGAELHVQWPEGSGVGTSTHRELADFLGRLMSKGILGQTTTTEPGPNGDRASTETRDQVRKDIGEQDCRAVAAELRYQMFMTAVMVNVGADVRVSAGLFQTEEGEDISEFSTAVKTLHDAGMRIPAKWARDGVKMPEPKDGEEVIEPSPVTVQVPGEIGPGKPGAKPGKPAKKPEGGPAPKQPKDKATGADDLPEDNGRAYTDAVERVIVAIGEEAIAPTLAEIFEAVKGAQNFADAQVRMLERYKGMAPAVDLANAADAAFTLVQAAGMLAINEEVAGGDAEP